MDRLIHHNDRITSLEEARLSPGQAGLLTGWGVFTTLRLYQSLPFAFDRHWTRLQRDAARLGVEIGWSQESAHKAVVELARANTRQDGMVRLSFVKNAGGLWSDAQDRPPADLLIFTRELVSWPATQRLRLEPNGTFSAGRYAGAKMLSWVSQAAALERARADGFDDALLLNEKGQLAECTSANIFLVRDGKVSTPPLACGCLPGVTREILIEVAPRAGIELLEKELTADDLSSAGEVFISSTTREAAAVEFIHPQWTYSAPGKFTLRLEQAFKEYVRAWLPSSSRSTGPPLMQPAVKRG